MKKMMIATAAILMVAGWVLAQESPLLKAAHVYTNTTPLESITYDTGSAVTSKIANVKYAVKVEELSNQGVWVDIGPASYLDPALIYTTNQVLTSVSTNNVIRHYVTSSILGIDTTDDPYVTNMQYIAATSNAVEIVSNYVTRIYFNLDIPDMATKTDVSGEAALRVTGDSYSSNNVAAEAALRVTGDSYSSNNVTATAALHVTKAGTTVMAYGSILSNLYEVVFKRISGNTNNLAVTGPGAYLLSEVEGTYTNAGTYNAKSFWAYNATNSIFYSTNEHRYVWWEYVVDTNVTGWATNSVSATSPIGIYKGFTGVATSAWETFVHNHTSVNQTNVVTYDRLNAAFLSATITNVAGTNCIWVIENGLIKSQTMYP